MRNVTVPISVVVLSLAFGCGVVSTDDSEFIRDSTVQSQHLNHTDTSVQIQRPGNGNGDLLGDRKRCDVDCSVMVTTPGTTCIARVYGSGYSKSEVSTCHNACNKAETDARTKLMSGCSIGTCNRKCSPAL
jgi:hypothetical protein